MTTNAKLPMTKLDAVNQMLHSIGQSPLNTIVGSIPKDASQAIEALDNTLREVCSTGWSFNQDTEYPLSPDGNGRVTVPAGATFADPTYGEDYVMRWDSGDGGALRLYDRDERSFTTFTADVKCEIIWLFDYEEIPQHARHYVYTKAARKFQAGLIGSRILYEYTADMEQEAYAGFRRIEKRQKNYNINRYSAGVSRRRNPTRY